MNEKDYSLYKDGHQFFYSAQLLIEELVEQKYKNVIISWNRIDYGSKL